jgi:large subunit ribosomal protein L7A
MSLKLPAKRIVGAKQTLKAAKGGIADIVYLAKDADPKVTVPIVEACKQTNTEIVYVNTMEELGKMCGIDVGAATACVTKE